MAGALLLFAVQPAGAQKAAAQVTICLDVAGIGPHTVDVDARTLGAHLRAGATLGPCPTGEDPTEEDPTGEDPAGEDPTGEDPTGEDPTGEDPTGEDPAGEDPASGKGNETEECDGLLSLAVRTEGETNVLDWELVAGAEAYIVYRAVVGGELEHLDTVNATTSTFVDADVVVGTTYEYVVTAVVAGVETSACVVVEVTAVPVFANVVAGVLAGVAGIGAYALRRRR